MCIVIDPGSFSCVFSAEDKAHPDFEPVKNWIMTGKGKMVLGGQTYQKEMEKTPRYLDLISELAKRNKVVVGCKQKIDSIEQELCNLITKSGFDDPHIVAIVIATRCRLVCTRDKKSIEFITDTDLYKKFPGRVKRPKLFTNRTNVTLLVNKNIATCCN